MINSLLKICFRNISILARYVQNICHLVTHRLSYDIMKTYEIIKKREKFFYYIFYKKIRYCVLLILTQNSLAEKEKKNRNLKL